VVLAGNTCKDQAISLVLGYVFLFISVYSPHIKDDRLPIRFDFDLLVDNDVRYHPSACKRLHAFGSSPPPLLLLAGWNQDFQLKVLAGLEHLRN